MYGFRVKISDHAGSCERTFCIESEDTLLREALVKSRRLIEAHLKRMYPNTISCAITFGILSVELIGPILRDS